MRKKRDESTDEKIVSFVLKYSEKNGYPPTVREIGKHLGISSSSTAHLAVSECEKNGHVLVNKGIARGIKVLPKGIRAYG